MPSDTDELLKNDEEYENYKLRRMKELKGHITEIVTENDLINKTQYETMIVHFYKNEFPSCVYMNTELDKIYNKMEDIKFYKIQADICPTVVNKLNISVLPFLGFFKSGYFVDQIVGFEDMGDHKYDRDRLMKRILDSNIYKPVSFIK